MIRLAFIRILNRKLVSFMLVFMLVSMMVLVPMGVQYAEESNLEVQNTIAEHGRGTYDILVRPTGSRTSLEMKHGMVEDNYIGDSKGGISIAEWRNIQQSYDIEVAAPVASVGYFTGKSSTVQLPELSQPGEMQIQYFTSDGKQEYPIGDPVRIVYFEKTETGHIQYIVSGLDDVGNLMMFSYMPPAYYHIAAVDMESEEQLTGIDFTELKNEVLEDEKRFLDAAFPNVPIINVIQRQELEVPIFLKIHKKTLDIELSEYQEKLGVSKEEFMMFADPERIQKAFEEISKLEPLEEKDYQIELSSYQKPFDGTALRLSENFQVLPADAYGIDLTETPVYYTSDKLTYIEKNGELGVSIVEDRKPPSYKKIQKHGKRGLETDSHPFVLYQVGEFTSSNERESKLTSAPLGIYSTEEVRAESGELLKPTTIPGSFIPQAAGGLITIESAESIKGPNPIDAVRVRVAGITSYTKEAQEKIETVATRLLKEGYEVDIVAGSSFQTVTLNVEGIGLAKAPWTTLGVAQKLEEGWNLISILSIILFSSFGLLWFITRMLFERNSLKEEDELLRLVGWSKRRIYQRNVFEQAILISLAFLISLLLNSFLHFDKDTYLWTFGIGLAFSILLTFVFRPSNKQFILPIKPGKILPALYYYRRVIFPAGIIIMISNILMTLQLVSIVSLFEEVQMTSLGQIVANQAMSFQIVILLVTLILSSFALGESLNALFKMRKDEMDIYYVIGWSNRTIARHIQTEVASWSVPAVGVGMLLSFCLMLSLNTSLYWSVVAAFSSGIVWVLLIFVLVGWTRATSFTKENDLSRVKPISVVAAVGIIACITIGVFIIGYDPAGEVKQELSKVPASKSIGYKEPVSTETNSSEASSIDISDLPKTIELESGAKGDYKLNVEMDDTGLFQIEAEILVTNSSNEDWMDVGFYFIPNAFTEDNKPDFIQHSGQHEINFIESNGGKLSFELQDARLTVQLPEPLPSGESQTILMKYSLKMSEDGFRLKARDNSFHLAQWYPMLAYYSEGWRLEDYYYLSGESYNTSYGSYDVTYQLPQEYLIVSSGEGDPSMPSSEGSIKANQVKDFYLALLDPEDWMFLTEPVGDTNIRTFLLKTDEKFSESVQNVARDAFQFFDKNIGKYESSELDLIGNRVQMEYPHVVDVSPESENVIVHEIAHQWFYHMTSNDPFYDGWIDEGLTQFVTSLYLTEKYRDSIKGFESPRKFLENSETVNEIANKPLTSFKDPNEYVSTAYGKVPLNLYSFFEKNGGEEEALRFLAAYFTEFRFKHVDSKQFSTFFIERYGEKSEAFLKEWLAL